MSTETVKTVSTYLIALVVIIGGGLLVIIPTRIPPSDLLSFVTGVVGVVIGYVFSDRSASSGSSNTLQALYTPTPTPPDNTTPAAPGPDATA